MRGVLITLLACPLFLLAQEGIRFENGLTWQQVKEKAIREHKFIFVDCFATWCGPCKQMDKVVYPVDSVGAFFNSNFISVKVQCDTSKNDNDTVKAAYMDAHKLVTEYKIVAYPTFLFFSPEGKPVHKDLGVREPRDFLALGSDALDAQKQYYTLVGNYRSGKMDHSTMPHLVSTAQKLQEKELAQQVAADYIHDYLEKLGEKAFFTKENFIFIGVYSGTIDSKARIFKWCFHHPAEVDSLLQDKGFSTRVINFTINKEIINPALEKAKKDSSTPDWMALKHSVRKTFGEENVDGNVLGAQIRWYHFMHDWQNYTKYLVAKMDHDHLEQNAPKDFRSLFGINVTAWDIFRHSERKEELEKAVSWSDLVLAKIEPKSGANYGACIDTKANLLYKLGRNEEALTLEAKAVELSPNDKGVQENYKKMKEGKPTWDIGLQ